MGYVKSTMPALLSATSLARVVFSPSLVSISPPNPSRVMLSPTFGAPAFEVWAVAAGAAGSTGVSSGAAAVVSSGSALVASSLVGFAFDLEGARFFGAGAGAAGAGLFLSSTMVAIGGGCHGRAVDYRAGSGMIAMRLWK